MRLKETARELLHEVEQVLPDGHLFLDSAISNLLFGVPKLERLKLPEMQRGEMRIGIGTKRD